VGARSVMTYVSSCHGTRRVLTVVPKAAVKCDEIGGVCGFLSLAIPGAALRLPLGRLGIVRSMPVPQASQSKNVDP
jgi:hypothetical protein